MKFFRMTSLLLILILLFAGCGTIDKQTGQTMTAGAGSVQEGGSETVEHPAKRGDARQACPNAIIDWVDVLMTGDIKYHHNYDGSAKVSDDQIGQKIGEVDFMMNEHACTGHVMKNGDAAFLPIGTEIYELKGYKRDFRVVADHKIYEVQENPRATTLGDLLDIDGKVEKVSIESSNDGSHIRDFDAEASKAFVQELLPLAYVGFDAIYAKTKHAIDEGRVFLRVHLQDGTSLRAVYYPDANAINPGAFGTEKLKEIIMSQVK